MSAGGGGGGGNYPSGSEASQLLRETAQEDRATEHRLRVNELLQDVLREVNQRDSEAMARHLETVQRALQNEVEGTVELRYGGSIQKHTYVDGLSDADLLAVLKRDTAEGVSPKDLIRSFASALRDRLPGTDVEAGDLSVKVRFSDGIELQILPAFKTRDGYRIARPYGETWSNVIRPREFANQLTSVNQRNGSKVVPIIKLLKVAQESLPRNARVSGYHAENIAVEAFQNYEGSQDLREMFVHYLRSAARRVETPIEDTTGQSSYVDRYLGQSGSDERRRLSLHLGRMANQLDEADRSNRIGAWRERFG